MIYGYYLWQERGDIQGRVDNIRGDTVFEFNDYQIFEDGFMQHPKDVAGLEEYLNGMGLIEGRVFPMTEFERRCNGAEYTIELVRETCDKPGVANKVVAKGKYSAVGLAMLARQYGGGYGWRAERYDDSFISTHRDTNTVFRLTPVAVNDFPLLYKELVEVGDLLGAKP
jgi:hypothetical protein